MKLTRTPQRIIWAVDADMEDKALFQKTVKTIRAWTRDSSVTIAPVYVLSPDQVCLPTEFFGEMHDELKTTGRGKLEKALEKISLPGLEPTTVIVSPNYSLRSAVHELVSHARNEGATLIVASTLSKKGVTRFLFGSFAETLVLQSDIPVLLISPKTQPVSKVSHILFPTDLSDKAREVFHTVLSLAADQKAKLTLFHKVEYLNSFSSPAFTPEIYHKCLDQDLERRRVGLAKLAQLASGRGVAVDIVTNTSGSSIVESIVKTARRMKVDLIALASQTGPVTTALLGSVTRQLVRRSSAPVWVVHPAAPGEVNPNRMETLVKNGRVSASSEPRRDLS